MEWPIHDVAEIAGVTTRTLRHYDSIGLLHPSRVGVSGYRYYDQASLVRLQRILLLRELGLGLRAIADILDGAVDDVQALTQHVRWLVSESTRIHQQIQSVTATIRALQEGEKIMAETMFDGFDHAQYSDEVRHRWGADAADSARTWWSGLDADGQRGFLGEHRAIQDAYDAALGAGDDSGSARVQQIAARHYAWIVQAWQGKRPDAAALAGLGDMYVCDPRFARNYTRVHANGAEFVRDALRVYGERQLGAATAG